MSPLSSYPYLSRLYVNFGGVAEAVCIYLKSLDVAHVAVFMYDTTVDAMGFYATLEQVAPNYGIVVYPFEFGINPNNGTDQLKEAVDNLNSSGINYIIGALHDRILPGYVEMNRFVLEYLIDNTSFLQNPEYFWVFTESLYYQFDESMLDIFQATDEKIANGLNQTAMLTMHGEINTVEDSRLDDTTLSLLNDREFWIYFESIREMRPQLPRPIPFSFDPSEFWLFGIVELWYVNRLFRVLERTRLLCSTNSRLIY
jgi:hypothetical protein